MSTLQDTLAEGGRDVHGDAERRGPARRGCPRGRLSATGTNTDDEALSVAVTADAETVAEGNAATFTMAVSGRPARPPWR